MRCLHQTRCWLVLLCVSFSLLLWYGNTVNQKSAEGVSILDGFARITPNGTTQKTAEGVSILDGFVRITPHNTTQFLSHHYHECAIVSSSGQMLGAHLGEEIEKFNTVIRMNNAPVRGFEKDVGQKTTVRVVSHTSVPSLKWNERYFFHVSEKTVYVIWGPHKKMRQDGLGSTYNTLLKLASDYPNVEIYAFTKEKVEYCDNVFEKETGKHRMNSGAYLSTGFFTMILAMEMCDQIRVFGMVNDAHCRGKNYTVVPYHYYDTKKTNECIMYRIHEHQSRGGHRFISEKTMFARWSKLHDIQFRHPTWTV
ncbi:alpha-N-acetyl-neuraminyl-2,3-beta-galactosyl-1,3-N-acetyl-galactosaminide alpha-2,6-sialyltransferase [Neosynchiropus ocellatus]